MEYGKMQDEKKIVAVSETREVITAADRIKQILFEIENY